jgi:hypothetical protein
MHLWVVRGLAMTRPNIGGSSKLPVIPVQRDARCPLHPPAAFIDWRESKGLQRAVWRGEPVWVISRYEDIRAALTDSVPGSGGFRIGVIHA